MESLIHGVNHEMGYSEALRAMQKNNNTKKKAMDKKKHWENIYQTKALTEVSWYQAVPQTSLAIVEQYAIPFDAKIIDIGGGDSYFVDHLLKLGYTHITVLDISHEAIERAKKRLGADAAKVNWIVADVTDFVPECKYDFWHDRAAFHFLNQEKEIEDYQQALQKGLKEEGLVVVATFSSSGPTKCSGIPIQQYSELSLKARFSADFKMIQSFTIDHRTPFDTVQNFTFGIFERKH